MTKRRLIRVDHSDYARVLVTETLPYETPIIFSSDGLYRTIHDLAQTPSLLRRIVSAVVFGEGTYEKPAWTVPLRFKIRKDSREFRRLGLLHPNAQWRIKEFYEKYESLILHYCSVSPVSIRAPERLASSFYVKSAWENLNKYKAGTVSLVQSDNATKHSPSFFAYRGFDRLYKFFESRSFYTLEKKYCVLKTLDVAKCFDSIYSHSLSWAVKDKNFTKDNVRIGGTFAQTFDRVMQFANYSETNGIVIGPEVSRIFAEIIFQKIDVLAIKALSEANLTRGLDYDLRRYVDDVFIFAKSEHVASSVYKRYADCLMDFNLFVNTGKSVTIERPFASPKSRLTSAASGAVNQFVNKFLVSAQDNDSLSPLPVRSEWKLARSFLDALKSLCAENDATYDAVASYVLAVLAERVKKLVNNEVDEKDKDSQRNFTSALLVLLEVQFFLYSVSPTVSASYRLCTSMLLTIRFARRSLVAEFPRVAQRTYDLISAYMSRGERDDDFDVEAFLSLETLNLLLAARELGPDHLLPASLIQKIFERQESLSYFQIMCCLWYTRQEAEYTEIRLKIIEAAKARLGDLSEVVSDAEQAYLLLDLVSCPFVPDIEKRALLKQVASVLQLGVPTNAELGAVLVQANHWHVDWDNVDLLSLLQRKELKQVY
jgi:hypothetical protein